MHSKKCLARALISAIENVRDYEDESDFDFRIAAQDNYFLTLADGYLSEEFPETCICKK